MIEPRLVTASHEVLFEPEAPACDVCGKRLDPSNDELRGAGLYVWSRGGQVVYEEAPLCATCGTAVSMSAFGRWEIEEEEG
jgi:hypothetical protein